MVFKAPLINSQFSGFRGIQKKYIPGTHQSAQSHDQETHLNNKALHIHIAFCKSAIFKFGRHALSATKKTIRIKNKI